MIEGIDQRMTVKWNFTLPLPSPVAFYPMSADTLFAFGIEQRPTSPIRLAHLDKLCADLSTEPKRPLICLEIGALFGESAKVLAKYGWVDSVDPWPDNSLETFLKNVNGLPVTPHRGFSKDILPDFPSQSFDLAYIDGDHKWPAPFDDICQCKRLVKPGGIICGDDFEKPFQAPVTAYELTQDFTNGYHPGVSLAVHIAFPAVNSQDGFWWVRI